MRVHPGEYRAVRSQGTRFLICPEAAHTNPEFETVLERHDRYWVVEKRGLAGEEAEYLADHGPSVLEPITGGRLCPSVAGRKITDASVRIFTTSFVRWPVRATLCQSMTTTLEPSSRSTSTATSVPSILLRNP